MANKLNVNPTRQELLNLKIRLKNAKRGHGLLKEKRDGLMKNFMAIIGEAKELRTRIEKNLGNSFMCYLFFSSKIDSASLGEAITTTTKKITLQASTKNVMGVEVPKFQCKEEGDFLCYDLATTPAMIDNALVGFSEVLRDMIKLAEIEHTAKLLAQEIEKTRRRVNALEYVFIPDTEETIKYINTKLNEQERATIITLMKVKDIIAE